MLPYKVMVRDKDGKMIHLADTLFLPEAKNAMRNWESGYITKDGSIIFQKKMFKPETD